MKTKLLVCAILLTFASCIKDYHGGGAQDIELTDENYVYEGDLYALYLDAEIMSTETKIIELEEIIANNQGDDKTKEELGQQYSRLGTLKAELELIIDLDQVLLGKPKPRPPCPQPKNCDFANFEYVVVPSTVKEIRLKILNDKNEQIGGGQIDNLMILEDTQGLLSVSKLAISPYQGPIKIEVTVLDEKGHDRMYLVE